VRKTQRLSRRGVWRDSECMCSASRQDLPNSGIRPGKGCIPESSWASVLKYLPRGRHGFDGSCRVPEACRGPTARNWLETRTANNNLALAA